MSLATSENNTQNSLSELIHLQIQYLKEHNAYDLAIANLLNLNVHKFGSCISIPDMFDWTNTSEGYDFWQNIQHNLQTCGICFRATVYKELFKTIFPVDFYPHLYI